MNPIYSLPLVWLARVKVAILKKEEVVSNLRRQHEVRRPLLFLAHLLR